MKWQNIITALKKKEKKKKNSIDIFQSNYLKLPPERSKNCSFRRSNKNRRKKNSTSGWKKRRKIVQPIRWPFKENHPRRKTYCPRLDLPSLTFDVSLSWKTVRSEMLPTTDRKLGPRFAGEIFVDISLLFTYSKPRGFFVSAPEI